jgi:hypothetical protein
VTQFHAVERRECTFVDVVAAQRPRNQVEGRSVSRLHAKTHIFKKG